MVTSHWPVQLFRGTSHQDIHTPSVSDQRSPEIKYDMMRITIMWHVPTSMN